MRPDRTVLVLTSGGLLGAALAGLFCAARCARRWTMRRSDWCIKETDVLLDLGRLV